MSLFESSPDVLLSTLRSLGLTPGDGVMVHASLRALGPIEGGAEAVASTLLDAVSPGGTLMAYVSWDRSPYLETLGGNRLTAEERDAWPVFDPTTSEPYPGYGILNRYLVRLPGAVRSAHPDASMVAIGPAAEELIHPHPPGTGYGPGSPIERFLEARGKVLLLGAPLDAITVLHYAEAVADIPNKRWVEYEMPMVGEDGVKRWVPFREPDSNGILEEFDTDRGPDAVEQIAGDYVRLGRHTEVVLGGATCRLFDAVDLVEYGVGWLEARFGSPTDG